MKKKIITMIDILYTIYSALCTALLSMFFWAYFLLGGEFHIQINKFVLTGRDLAVIGFVIGLILLYCVLRVFLKIKKKHESISDQ